MRVAVVSDIHANLTALEAVVADLKHVSADLIVHGAISSAAVPVLGTRRVVYGHIHCAYVRRLPSFTVANSGSVSLSYDGDPRAAYVVLDDDHITVRRVEYDIEREINTLFRMKCPDAASIADMLRRGIPLPPPGMTQYAG